MGFREGIEGIAAVTHNAHGGFWIIIISRSKKIEDLWGVALEGDAWGSRGRGMGDCLIGGDGIQLYPPFLGNY
jgi:hypothetical protein